MLDIGIHLGTKPGFAALVEQRNRTPRLGVILLCAAQAGAEAGAKAVAQGIAKARTDRAVAFGRCGIQHLL